MKMYLIFVCSFLIMNVMAKDDTAKRIDAIYGVNKNQKFSYHSTNYFVFGDDDLKIQLGFKYRLARTFSFYVAYSQLMFWDIYDESKPFEDVNYKPELFYRFLEGGSKVFQSIDVGYLHTSNGQSGETSRSLDRLMVRSNFASKINRHSITGTFMLYGIYNEDVTNEDIVNHLGYWEANVFLTDIIRIQEQQIDFELKTYAGSEVVNFDQGAYQLGLIYRVGSDNFNPAIYLQRFEGYSENLLNYNKRSTEWRLGLMLTI